MVRNAHGLFSSWLALAAGIATSCAAWYLYPKYPVLMFLGVIPTMARSLKYGYLTYVPGWKTMLFGILMLVLYYVSPPVMANSETYISAVIWIVLVILIQDKERAAIEIGSMILVMTVFFLANGYDLKSALPQILWGIVGFEAAVVFLTGLLGTIIRIDK